MNLISRRGYRSHTTKLLSEIPTLLTAKDIDELVSTIKVTLEQLQRKQTILEELDTKIAPLITEESELEEEIMAAEDTRTKILHGITRLAVKLSSITTTPPEPTLTTISRSHPPH